MPRKKRTPSSKQGEGNGSPPPASAGSSKEPPGMNGRFASELVCRDVEWLLYPWVPLGLLTLLVGEPSAGKSTFLAWLLAGVTNGEFAKDKRNSPCPMRAIVLPGHEEDPEVLLGPRLKACGVRMSNLRTIEEPGLSLLKDKKRIAREVQLLGASLVVGDPIDSYVDDSFSEDRGQDVRPLLEAAVWIAKESGAAVLFARHPGKDPRNVCPGSRQWAAVPKGILQLHRDGDHPPGGMLSYFRDKLGTGAKPRRYILEGEPGKPRQWTWGDEVDHSGEEMVKSANGPAGRFKLIQACRLLRWIFDQETEPTRQMYGEEARRQGLGDDLLYEAMRLLGVKAIPPSERGLPWLLVRTASEWPAWLPQEGGV